MSPKLLPANNLDPSPRVGQVADEGVQAEPALGRAHQPLVPDLRPAPLHPTDGSRRQRAAEGGKWHPCIGAQREVQALEFPLRTDAGMPRSEEHTSELQSQSNLVCRLLLEKKKQDVN